jgi:transposase
MAMGRRQHRERQEDLWVAHTQLAAAPGHPFYERLNAVLDAEGFDRFVEELCARFYAPQFGRPSLTPGIYFRSLLIGYFEGLGAERGIAWRLADSLALRRFVGIALDEYTPDHSTISRTRRLIDLDTHAAVFAWVLDVLARRGLIVGKRVAIDATTLEANAAMRSIVRRDTGESYNEFLTGLAQASGIETPTREELTRLDRKRKKRTSNKEWKSPVDEDARVAKMKDGRTHLAHKAEHAVDLDSGAVVAVTLQAVDKGDTTTMDATLIEAGMAVAELVVEQAGSHSEESKINIRGIEELVADKGYLSGAVLKRVKSYGVRSYIPEKRQKGKRRWAGNADEQQATYENRRRVRGDYGKRLLRRSSELVERSFAHCYETGGLRRCHLRGRENILERQLIHVGAFNLSLILRKILGAGTPRELKNRATRLVLRILRLLVSQNRPESAVKPQTGPVLASSRSYPQTRTRFQMAWNSATCTTGC